MILFILTIVAAGYKIYKSIELVKKDNERRSELMSILKQEIQDNWNDQEVFSQKGTIQKTNAAIAAREKRATYQELRNTPKNLPPYKLEKLSIFEIVQFFLLKVALQISALVF